MGIWPFRRRRKKSSSKAPGRGITAEKQPATVMNATPEFQVLRKSSISRYPPSRRSSYRRRHAGAASSANHLSYAASSGIFVPDHAVPLSSDEERAFTPQKQEHHSGAFASYFSEGEYSPVQSRESLQRSPPYPVHNVDRHLPSAQEQPAPRRTPSAARISGVIRKLSKRRKDSRPPPSAGVYNLGRHSSRSQRSAYGDRPYSQASGVHASIHSIESQASGGAYRIRSFSVLAPRPKLVYEEGNHSLWNQSREFQPTLVPSRSNSRRTTTGDVRRYKGPAVSQDNFVHREDRIDDLVLELDDHELREAMERDQRRRQKKRQEAEERLQRRLQRQSCKPPAVSGTLEARDDGYGSLEHDVDMHDYEVAPSRQVVQSDEELDTRPAEDTGNQTPLSWFNDNPSVEQINKQYSRYQPRDNVVTPISMDSRDGCRDEPEPIHEEKDSPTLPPDPMMAQPPLVEVSSASPDHDLETRTKTSGWTSFIRRATAARIRKGQESRQEGAGERNISESDNDDLSAYATANQRGTFLEVEDLRHREGQTPGRHVPNEILNAMTALETGHFREKNNREYEDEMRDTLPTPPNLAYQQDDGQASSRSSLERAPKQHLNNGSVRAVSQQSFNRPPSASRYSPSLGRYASGSPDGFRPRSAMSTSLASIDSEGSWLSGKITPNPRSSLQQISPLRTSASSLRRQYHELDDESNIPEDEFFTGVRPKSAKTNADENDDEDDLQGGALLDLDQSDESPDEGSIGSEAEQKMWREGVEKKVSVEEHPPFLRAASSQGFLNEGSDETVKTIASIKADTDKPKDDDQITIKDIVGEEGDQKSRNDSMTTFEEFVTPSENPFNPLGSAFQTPAEEYRTPMGEPMKTLGGNGP